MAADRHDPAFSTAFVAPGDEALRAVWRCSMPGLAAVALFSVFVNLLRLSTPIFALQVFDRVLSSGSLETLVMLAAIALVAAIAAALLAVVRRSLLIQWASWVERGFGPYLFEVGLSRNARTRSRAEAPRSSSKLLGDLETLRHFIAGGGMIAWMDVVWAPVFLLLVFFISPQISYIGIVLSLVAIIIAVIVENASREGRHVASLGKIDERHWLLSAEQGQETVSPLNMGPNLGALWSRGALKRADERLRLGATRACLVECLRFLRAVLRISILGVGVWLVVEHMLTIGAVIAAAYLSRSAYSLVENAVLRWRDMIGARDAYGRIRVAMQDHDTGNRSLVRGDRAFPLVLNEVGFRYPGQGKSVFNNVSVTVAPGEALYAVGPSASGKTTLSRLVAGVLKPKMGRVLIGDVSLHLLAQDAKASHLGYLPQTVQLFKGTVRENIARMAEGDISLVMEAAKLAGVHETVLQLPDGYETGISEDEPLLSAGTRKRIAIARAFYGWPALVVLDEPESHLDRQGRNALAAAIKALKANGSIVVVTTPSRNAVSRNANKLVVFGNAKPVVYTAPDEIAEFRTQKRLPSPRRAGNDEPKAASGGRS